MHERVPERLGALVFLSFGAHGRGNRPFAGAAERRVIVREPGAGGLAEGHGTAEIYNRADSTWATPAKLSQPRASDARMATLSDGRLVITSSYNPLEIGELGGQQSTADVYDPRTGTWTETAPAFDHRAQHVAVAVRDDSVLSAGDMFDTRRSERLVFPVSEPPRTGSGRPKRRHTDADVARASAAGASDGHVLGGDRAQLGTARRSRDGARRCGT